jgi:hypothetical protein
MQKMEYNRFRRRGNKNTGNKIKVEEADIVVESTFLCSFTFCYSSKSIQHIGSSRKIIFFLSLCSIAFLSFSDMKLTILLSFWCFVREIWTEKLEIVYKWKQMSFAGVPCK